MCKLNLLLIKMDYVIMFCFYGIPIIYIFILE
jgi:hypothetical protein